MSSDPRLSSVYNMFSSRTAAVTANVLKEYKDLITNTTSDLEEHLQEIENKLQSLSSQGARISENEKADLKEIQQEKDSTKQCLVICAEVSEHVEKYRFKLLEDISAPPNTHQVLINRIDGLRSSKQDTANALQEFRGILNTTTSGLTEHLHEMENRLRSLRPQGGLILGNDRDERGQIQEELDSIKQCLAICAQASEQMEKVRTNVFEDVLAAQDASLRQLSQDRLAALVTQQKCKKVQVPTDERFEDQYGAGQKDQLVWKS